MNWLASIQRKDQQELFFGGSRKKLILLQLSLAPKFGCACATGADGRSFPTGKWLFTLWSSGRCALFNFGTTILFETFIVLAIGAQPKLARSSPHERNIQYSKGLWWTICAIAFLSSFFLLNFSKGATFRILSSVFVLCHTVRGMYAECNNRKSLQFCLSLTAARFMDSQLGRRLSIRLIT